MSSPLLFALLQASEELTVELDATSAIVLVLVNMVVTQLIARRKGAPKVWLYRIVNGYISLK